MVSQIKMDTDGNIFFSLNNWLHGDFLGFFRTALKDIFGGISNYSMNDKALPKIICRRLFIINEFIY